MKKYFFIFFGVVFCGMSGTSMGAEFKFHDIPKIFDLVSKCCENKNNVQDFESFIKENSAKINKSARIPMYGLCEDFKDTTCIGDGDRTALDFVQGIIKIGTNAHGWCRNLRQCERFEEILLAAGAKTYKELHPTSSNSSSSTTWTVDGHTFNNEQDYKNYMDNQSLAVSSETKATAVAPVTTDSSESSTEEGGITSKLDIPKEDNAKVPEIKTADMPLNAPDIQTVPIDTNLISSGAGDANTNNADAEKAVQDKKNLEAKQDAYDKAKEKEQSTANRMLGGLTTATTGMGGMQLAMGLAEKSADKAAEQDMAAYIATFRCNYGDGKQFKAGPDEIELPGGNNQELMNLRGQYLALAADLKERKTALGMKPGIESEEILDKATSGLYDDESLGIESGNYASLYRAQALNSETDQKKLSDQQKEAKNRVIAGGVLAGAGVAGGVLGNSLINGKLHDKIQAKKANKNATKEEKEALEKLQKCLKDGGAKNTKDLKFDNFTPSVLHLEKIYCSGKEWTAKVNNKDATKLFADTTDEATIKTALIENFECDLAGNLLDEDLSAACEKDDGSTPPVDASVNLSASQNPSSQNVVAAPVVTAPGVDEEEQKKLAQEHNKEACESGGDKWVGDKCVSQSDEQKTENKTTNVVAAASTTTTTAAGTMAAGTTAAASVATSASAKSNTSAQKPANNQRTSATPQTQQRQASKTPETKTTAKPTEQKENTATSKKKDRADKGKISMAVFKEVQVNLAQGKKLIEMWGKKNNKKNFKYISGSEEIHITGDDRISYEDDNNVYVFEFDDLSESDPVDRGVGIGKAVCQIQGGKFSSSGMGANLECADLEDCQTWKNTVKSMNSRATESTDKTENSKCVLKQIL